MLRTVGEVARIARVSVRTLHHYDEIGLLSPSGRTDAKYRLYTREDLERLHQILVYRELGFPLHEISRILHGPDFDRPAALRRQRDLLIEQTRRNQRMISALGALIASLEGDRPMSDDQFDTLFDGFTPSAYQEEAQHQWGHTPQYRQSVERTKRYTGADWTRMKAEMTEINAAYVQLMERGVEPGTPEAQEVARRHRDHISRWFYDCTPEMFGALAQVWVNDPRFTRNIDRSREGLAAYQSAAAQALVATELVPQ